MSAKRDSNVNAARRKLMDAIERLGISRPESLEIGRLIEELIVASQLAARQEPK